MKILFNPMQKKKKRDNKVKMSHIRAMMIDQDDLPNVIAFSMVLFKYLLCAVSSSVSCGIPCICRYIKPAAPDAVKVLS